MFIPRHLQSSFEKANDFFPALLLTGPRQVGKTTFLRRLSAPDRKYVTFDDAGLRLLAREDPRGFLDRFSPPVLIDEIQYVPELLSYIKILIDEQRFHDSEKAKGMFWFTGSQQFSLMRDASESLAGRIGIFEMSGLSQSELAGRPNIPFTPEREFDDIPYGNTAELFQKIWYGCYPEVQGLDAKQRELFYSSYVNTYLERDIRNLTSVQDLDRFYKFLCSCAARTGQLLNNSELARDAGVDISTVQSWLSILTTAQLVYLLPSYASSLTSRLVKAPKLYMLDSGLCTYLTRWPSPETLEAGAMAGAIFETWCIAEILKSYWNDGQNRPRLFYYRDKDKREIDLLIEAHDGFHPIECKKSATPKAEDTRHFGALARLGKTVHKGALLCSCDKIVPMPKQNVICIPAAAI